MGLLDDAIREHLSLKRRRGADPAEVERAEREALGPVRREPFDSVGDEPELAPADGAYDQEEELYEERPVAEGTSSAEPDWGDAFDEETEARRGAPPGAQEPDDATRVMGSTPFEDELALDEEAVPSGPSSAGPIGDETAAYDIDEAVGPEQGQRRSGPGGPSAREPEALPADDEFEAEGELESQPGPEKSHGDGVLEERQDFLRDTPKHDRPWSEKRPPRDFDFDD